jgi:hypothetical protein
VENVNELRESLLSSLKSRFQSLSLGGEFPLKGDIQVGFIGSFGGRQCSPRALKSQFNGNMVMVEGIVTKGLLIVICI